MLFCLPLPPPPPPPPLSLHSPFLTLSTVLTPNLIPLPHPTSTPTLTLTTTTPRRLKKAAEAAIQARQWGKAVQIVEMQDPSLCKEYFAQIAAHYASAQDYEVGMASPYSSPPTPSHPHIAPPANTSIPSHHSHPPPPTPLTRKVAEQYFVKAEKPHDAVDMYVKAERWEEAYKVAASCMPQGEVKELYVSRARELEGLGKLREAERLYAVMGDSDLAISMYKRHKQVKG